MKKIISSSGLSDFILGQHKKPQQLLTDLSEKLRQLITRDKLDVSSGVGKGISSALKDINTIIAKSK